MRRTIAPEGWSLTFALDHVIVGVPDLDSGMAWFADSTGVAPAAGGAHPGFGTHNAVASLGGGQYLELLAVDPAQDVTSEMTAALGGLDRPTAFGWCFQCADVEAATERLDDAGVQRSVIPFRRSTPDGVDLTWSVVFPHTTLGPVIPFFIAWGDTPSPAARAPQGCTLETVVPVHPQPQEAQAMLRGMGIDGAVEPALTSGIRIHLNTPRREVTVLP